MSSSRSGLDFAALFYVGSPIGEWLGRDPWRADPDAPERVRETLGLSVAPVIGWSLKEWGSCRTRYWPGGRFEHALGVVPSLPAALASFVLWHEAVHCAQAERLGYERVNAINERAWNIVVEGRGSRAAQLAYASTPLEAEANEVAYRHRYDSLVIPTLTDDREYATVAA